MKFFVQHRQSVIADFDYWPSITQYLYNVFITWVGGFCLCGLVVTGIILGGSSWFRICSLALWLARSLTCYDTESHMCSCRELFSFFEWALRITRMRAFLLSLSLSIR